MAARNNLLEAPPYAVAQTVKKVGQNLRLAKLRRQQTIEEVAERIGTGRRARCAFAQGIGREFLLASGAGNRAAPGIAR
jgi:hypothetical protein